MQCRLQFHWSVMVACQVAAKYIHKVWLSTKNIHIVWLLQLTRVLLHSQASFGFAVNLAEALEDYVRL